MSTQGRLADTRWKTSEFCPRGKKRSPFHLVPCHFFNLTQKGNKAGQGWVTGPHWNRLDFGPRCMMSVIVYLVSENIQGRDIANDHPEGGLPTTRARLGLCSE